MSPAIGGHPQFKGLTWLAGLLATIGAGVVGTVLAVIFAATVVVITLMGAALMTLAALALNAKRSVHARDTSTDGDVIEARNVGGHSWVAYGWDQRGR